jgi:hypothetical protein
VGVDVQQTRSKPLPVRVVDGFALTGWQSTTQGRNLAVFDRHIAYATGTAMTIKYLGVLDYQIPLHNDYLSC